MQLRPILSSLRRHKLTVVLLVLQVAFTCAIICNATFLIIQRMHRLSAISGVDETALSVVGVYDTGDSDAANRHAGDLAALRMIPGVEAASIISNLPMSGNQSSSGACGSLDAIHSAMKAQSTVVPGCAEPDEYDGGTNVLRTLGLTLVSGRDFNPDEYVEGRPGAAAGRVSAVIISEALANELYPHGQAVGRSLYFGADGFHGNGTPIVGVVAHLGRGNLVKGVANDRAILLPVEPADSYAQFILRSRPQDRAQIIRAAVAVLAPRVPNRQVSLASSRTYEQMRAAYFRHDTTMISLLLASGLGLLFVTALGIAGLASFWVQQRTRSIGIRRAIGARRGDILHYFQTENFLIVGAGVVLGVLLALALNLLLMRQYELPRLPLFYLPIGAAAMWLLGQLAVLSPALRASAVPPVVATRSV